MTSLPLPSPPPPRPVQPQDVQLHGETETLTVLPFADEKSKGGNTARNQRLSDPNLGNLASGWPFSTASNVTYDIVI